MKIVKKALSALIAVVMLSASVVVFADATAPTVKMTLMSAEEAQYYSLIDEATIGLKVEWENCAKDAKGFNMHIKIPAGFEVVYNSGTATRPKWVTEAISNTSLMKAFMSSPNNCTEDEIGTGTITFFATPSTGDIVEGEYAEFDFQCVTLSNLNTTNFMVILCNGDRSSLSEKAFEVDTCKIAYYGEDVPVDATIVNWWENTGSEVTYPEDGSEAVEVSGTTYKCWTFADQNVADFYNSGGKTIELSLYEDDAVSETKEQKVFLPEDPGSGTFTFKVYASISDVYKKVTCKIK